MTALSTSLLPFKYLDRASSFQVASPNPGNVIRSKSINLRQYETRHTRSPAQQSLRHHQRGRKDVRGRKSSTIIEGQKCGRVYLRLRSSNVRRFAQLLYWIGTLTDEHQKTSIRHKTLRYPQPILPRSRRLANRTTPVNRSLHQALQPSPRRLRRTRADRLQSYHRFPSRLSVEGLLNC